VARFGDYLTSDGKSVDEPAVAIAEEFPGVPHQRPWHLQDEVYHPVLGRFHFAQMFADAEKHVVAQEAAALGQALQRSCGLRIDIAADFDEFLKHAVQARTGDLVMALDDGRRAVE